MAMGRMGCHGIWMIWGVPSGADPSPTLTRPDCSVASLDPAAASDARNPGRQATRSAEP